MTAEIAIIDAGDNPELIRAGARLSDRALIPVRFSPLSAYAALATDRLLASLPEDRRETLVARRDELKKPETLERIARELGMVRAAEKAYVVTGLPPG